FTKEDAVSGSIPDDAIGLFSYFIDIHSGKGDKTYTKTIEEPYGIPYGCTVAKDIDGLMMTGRCISVDAVAFGSTRIMTLCMAIGQGAGVGAALASKNKIQPRKVDPEEVRKILLQKGAILTLDEAK
ncbi:MAG TPA: FAD-dependent oxidoreductase, partial [Lachnospiraceae bacterium]|nr:FAD-dependent oxidoreductase [Lachnospiraceae bacterium]